MYNQIKLRHSDQRGPKMTESAKTFMIYQLNKMYEQMDLHSKRRDKEYEYWHGMLDGYRDALSIAGYQIRYEGGKVVDIEG